MTGGAKAPSSEPAPLVCVVDDDLPVREALGSLLRSVGLRVKLFGSPGEFFDSDLPQEAGCLVLDIRMPGLSGLDFQDRLAKANIHMPIVFMTGHGDIPMSVKAMKAGAVEFLTKPLREQDLLDAVRVALEHDRARRESEKSVSNLRARVDRLTPREHEVLSLVSAGLMNKQVAGKLGVSEIMVKVHRGNVMRKMGAKSLADLVVMAEALGIRGPKK
jgi:FixJ family two-component response regulator